MVVAVNMKDFLALYTEYAFEKLSLRSMVLVYVPRPTQTKHILSSLQRGELPVILRTSGGFFYLYQGQPHRILELFRPWSCFQYYVVVSDAILIGSFYGIEACLICSTDVIGASREWNGD